MTVRVGVIGAGAMGASHVRTLAESVPGARVTRVLDQDQARAAASSAVAGAEVAASAADLIGSVEVDAQEREHHHLDEDGTREHQAQHAPQSEDGDSSHDDSLVLFVSTKLSLTDR